MEGTGATEERKFGNASEGTWHIFEHEINSLPRYCTPLRKA